ncbi:PglL family O-oligosaccharyltransferase [Glaciimonas sp. PCH181]|uniref:PglL family O-oligosaccharyltransferase n=1 Tax=Glaciimonas sp. PCH181 TaxID=2133943 RepID=UPI000D363622|nr:O-antigen ligase family protein [Glaciimonas sp. PCH181]PUA18480.1 hypothetical protein C7W93_00500 [Glaciimonas sp. PCH181]
MSLNKKVISPFWMVIASLALSCTWLLPNHYPPWTTFHSDAWASIVLTMVGMTILLLRLRERNEWHWPEIVVAVLIFIPIAQFFFGMLPFWGVAWINSIYLTGLLLALLAGTRWEKAANGECADFLFLGIGIAALISMYFQLHQLLRFDGFDIWILKSNDFRPGANLGQPNQFATLLILGMLASAWGFKRRQLSAPVAILMTCFLLLGVALTQSRTGWLNVFVILAALLLWAWFLRSKRMLATAIGLGLYFIACVINLPWIIDSLLFEGNRDLAERYLIGARPQVWRMFIDAVQHQSLFGYGWGQLTHAQYQVANEHPDLGMLFFQSHNLFLDLILWNGIPIGLLISGLIIWWFLACVRRIKDHEDAILLLFITVLATHAMLELPLHYAYFLLPAGLVVGVLNVRLGFRSVFVTRSWITLTLFVLSTTALSITILDYLRVESSFNVLRFENAHVGKVTAAEPPDVLALTQFREMIRYARIQPKMKFDAKELNWMRDVVEASPSPYGVYQLALALAVNGKPDEAQRWLQRLCKTSPDEQCQGARNSWEIEARKNRFIAAVAWPVKR